MATRVEVPKALLERYAARNGSSRFAYLFHKSTESR